SIEIDGELLDHSKPASVERVRTEVSMLFQGAALFDSLNVEENVGFALREHFAWPADRVKQRVAECLAEVNLSGLENKMPSELSGGMKKRVGLARALASNPKILL